MGLLSSIGKIVGKVADFAGDFSGNPIVQIGSEILGNVLTNNANSEEAAQNRAFQADQSGTAYQRAVLDLKAAGLNPMLAYTNGGANSGSGAQAVMQNLVGNSMSNAMQTRRIHAEMANMRETNENIRAMTRKAEVDTKNSTDLTKSNLVLNNLLGIKAVSDSVAARANAAKSLADAGSANAVTAKINQEILGAENDAYWRKKHPRTVNLGNYINTLLGGTTAAANASSAVRNMRPHKPAPRLTKVIRVAR